MLELTQPLNRIVIVCIAGKMESADSFYCGNTAVCNYLPHICDRFRSLTVLFIIKNEHFRSAFVAAYGLGVISSRGRIVVFLFAVRTHRKFLHRCAFAVIRQCIKNSKSRAAACAINERMQISSVVLIEKLLKALVTDCDVRRYEDLAGCFRALDYIEIIISRNNLVLNVHL